MDAWTIARDHAATRRRTAATATSAAVRAWRGLDAAEITASWFRVAPVIQTAVTTGQFAAASTAGSYVSAVLDAEGESASGSPVDPRAFAGTTADGRSLDTLLRLPLATVFQQIRDGAAPTDALRVGGNLLALLADSEVADAGRAADSVAMAAEPKVAGYIRVISGGACGRCAILAGRWYRWNAAFDRHPHCNCQQVPATDREQLAEHLTDPGDYFASLTRAQQDRAFTIAGAQAIRDGGDIFQVVNARRGIKTVRVFGQDVSTTTEGITRRGLAGQRMRSAGIASPVRLTPQAIYSLASDRSDAIRLLRRYGYIL